MTTLTIKKGDQVKILTGKDKGKEGRVLRVHPKEGRVLVEGLNVYKRRIRPRRQGEKGQVVDLPRPLTVSNVMLVCKSCKKATRVGHRVDGDRKLRICKKCQAEN
ncbi:MAG: 50S ribosomal protein L24 [Anaplasmataceae bacterium]|nr:50S ribosomal protein L24 [Anaplasmataceae bacterium]